MDFGFRGGGGGGGGTSARLKCVWARNVFERQRHFGQNYPAPTTRSMLWCNFLWGLRNWLHNKAERGGPYRCGGLRLMSVYNFEITFTVLNHAMSECSC